MGKEKRKQIAKEKKEQKKSRLEAEQKIIEKEKNMKQTFLGKLWIKIRDANKLIKITVFSPLIAITLFGGATLVKISVFEFNLLINPESFFSVEMENSDIEYDYFCKTCSSLISLNPNTYKMEMLLVDIPFQFKIKTHGGLVLNDINIYYRSNKYNEKLSSISYANPVIVDSEKGLRINNSSKPGEKPSNIPVVGYAISESGGTQKVLVTEGDYPPFFERTDLSTCSKNEGCYLGIMHYYGDEGKKFGYNIVEFSDTSVANKKYHYVILHISEGKTAKYEIYKLNSFDIEKLDAFLTRNEFNNESKFVENEYSKIKDDEKMVKDKIE